MISLANPHLSPGVYPHLDKVANLVKVNAITFSRKLYIAISPHLGHPSSEGWEKDEADIQIERRALNLDIGFVLSCPSPPGRGGGVREFLYYQGTIDTPA
jgi:hypothetical protein